MEEMRQSLRIIQQCVNNMPSGKLQIRSPAGNSTKRKDKTMTDIETLITHFVNVSWGPVIPEGEAMVPIEAAKGSNGYYLISRRKYIIVPDKDTVPLPSRIFRCCLLSVKATLFLICWRYWGQWILYWRIWIGKENGTMAQRAQGAQGFPSWEGLGVGF